MRFGDAFADRDGRRVATDVTFRTGTLALAVEPTPRVSADGVATWPMRCTAELAEGALRAPPASPTPRGAAVPFRLTGEGRGCTLVLDTVPEGRVRVEIAGDLRSREGGDPLGAPVRRDVAWSRDLTLADVDVDADGAGGRRGPRLLAPARDAGPRRHAYVATPAPKGLVVRARDGGVRLRVRSPWARPSS